MGLWPTQGDEKRLLETQSLPLVIPTGAPKERRDLRFGGSFLEMFFDRAYPDFLLRNAGNGHACGSP
jgi:hypothetical protein